MAPIPYASRTREQLADEIDQLSQQIEEICAQGLALNMARGKPSSQQLDLSRPMLDVINSTSELNDEDVDCRNYGCFEGIPSARAFFAELFGVDSEQIFVGGESSLNLEFDVLEHAMVRGVLGEEPMLCQMQRQPLKWICLVPGYDRHFGITEHFGFELITAPLTGEGPDMDCVEELVRDPSVKGMWCVPQYSNPTGETYSHEVVQRIAQLRPAASDFRVYWDDAYCAHHLYDTHTRVANIFEAAHNAGNPNLVYGFCSTSKMTFPGAGVSALATSLQNLSDITTSFSHRIIGHDKLNQLRHMRFFGGVEGLYAHMQKHADVLRPKFELVERRLSEDLGGLGIATWTQPHGGYFVSFDGPCGSAKRIVALAKELGVTLTSAGATWPYGIDPSDTNIRIAPTLPPLEELDRAMSVFTTCVRLVAAQGLYA